jgi:hypothetical protein
VADRHPSGVLDTCAYIDLDLLDPTDPPAIPELTAITMAKLQQGVAMAKDAGPRAARMEKPGAAVADFDPLPFNEKPPQATALSWPSPSPHAAIPAPEE